MNFAILLVVLLLAVIAVKIPTADEIGDGVLSAQERRVERIRRANAAVDAAEAQRLAAERQRQAAAAQAAAFDASPKFDQFGKPINRAVPAQVGATPMPAPRYRNPLER